MPDSRGEVTEPLRLSDSEEGSSGSASGNNSPTISPTISTSFFGKSQLGNKRGKKVSCE